MGPQATLSRQPPVFLPGSYSSCSDHLLSKPKPVKTEFNCSDSRYWSKRPAIQGAFSDILKWQTEVRYKIPVSTTSTPWSPKVKDEHQKSSDRHRHLIIESLLWTVKVNLTKSATCFSIRAALQCKCSTSVFFDLNEDMVLRNMSLYAIHSNKVGGLQHLCLSRFTSSALQSP